MEERTEEEKKLGRKKLLNKESLFLPCLFLSDWCHPRPRFTNDS